VARRAEMRKQSWIDPRIGGQDRIASPNERLEGRGPALTIDYGWQEGADKAVTFVQRFAPTA
jgi:hypothetical protein